LSETSTDRVERTYRRTDLDWLRIAAFGLLIVYHVGMFYVPWEWEVKSPRLLPWLQIPMWWSSPWRLLLLFIVSGAATRFMLAKQRSGTLLQARSLRLLPPLFFALLIVVPPQSYVQVVTQFGYRGSFWQFLARDLTGDHSFCHADGCLILPTWKHLWFVAYLWLYTVLLAGALKLAPALLTRWQELGRRMLSGWRLLIVPAFLLFLARLSLKHFFPETHDLIDDWYLHVVYLLCFLFGFLFAFSEEIWTGFMRMRWIALILAIGAFGVTAAYRWHYQATPGPLPLRVLMVAAYGIDQWAWTVAALGFARRYLCDRDTPARRYLTEAIFPYYIVHQTVIVVMAYRLLELRLPLAWEAALLIATTVVSCVLTYEIVRRIGWLRPWFGLKTARPSLVKAPQVGTPINPASA
jgi:glucans biosynthesis protein C